MTIPVIGNFKNDFENSLYFQSWFPDQDNIMISKKKNMSIKIWFDVDCVAIPFPSYNIITLDESLKEHIKEYKNKKLKADKFYIDVTVNDLSNEIINFIFEGEKNYTKNEQVWTEDYHRLVNEYKLLSGEIIKSSINIVNRMFIYFRTYKKHFWLSEYNIGSDNDYICNYYPKKFCMKVKSDDNNWVEWYKELNYRRKKYQLPLLEEVEQKQKYYEVTQEE
jgi:hypothetical protein